jgi:hypothetical protein
MATSTAKVQYIFVCYKLLTGNFCKHESNCPQLTHEKRMTFAKNHMLYTP